MKRAAQRKTKEAFCWIVGILRKHKVKFMISGGLAARLYGSKRELRDIDIEIPDNDFSKILPDVKQYLTYKPKRFRNKTFDLFLMSLRYKGQDIDIAGTRRQFLFDRRKKRWTREFVNLSKAKMKAVYGLKVPVIPLRRLISYKKKISRYMDVEDVNSLELIMLYP